MANVKEIKKDCDEIINYIVRGYVYATESAVDLEEVGCVDEVFV
jgi:hypothetical protein